jgi:hypothetical protein
VRRLRSGRTNAPVEIDGGFGHSLKAE